MNKQRGKEERDISDDDIHLCSSVLEMRASSSRHGGERDGVSHLRVVEIEGKR
jgi:hypothetical protein